MTIHSTVSGYRRRSATAAPAATVTSTGPIAARGSTGANGGPKALIIRGGSRSVTAYTAPATHRTSATNASKT